MFVVTNDGEAFQVCQTNDGREQVWREDPKELLAEGDLVQVVNGVITCFEGIDPVWSSDAEAEGRE